MQRFEGKKTSWVGFVAWEEKVLRLCPECEVEGKLWVEAWSSWAIHICRRQSFKDAARSLAARNTSLATAGDFNVHFLIKCCVLLHFKQWNDGITSSLNTQSIFRT